MGVSEQRGLEMVKGAPSSTVHYVYVASKCDDPNPAVYEKNCVEALKVGIELVKKGYVPFIPHMALHGCYQFGLTRQDALLVGLLWLMRCDALFYHVSSPGTDGELKIAKELGMPIFDSLDEVPDSKYLDIWKGLVVDEK